MHNPPLNIPESSKFLKGVGESAWFYIEATKDKSIFVISRYTTNGELECKNTFTLQTKGFNLAEDFEMTYVSHCTKCTVIQNRSKYSFVKIV